MKLTEIFAQTPKKQEFREPEELFVPILEGLIQKYNEEKPFTSDEPAFRASGLGYCQRKTLYKLRGFVDERAPKDNFTLNIGTVVHELIQSYIKESEYGISSEEEISVEQIPNTNGHYDYLLLIRGKKYLLEIKTSNVEAFQRLIQRPIPYEKHKRQATFYMMALGVDETIFLYVNKNVQLISDFKKENPEVNETFLEIRYKIENKFHKSNIEEIKSLKEHFNNGTMPEHKLLSECSYCPKNIKEQCKKDRKLEKKARKEKEVE